MVARVFIGSRDSQYGLWASPPGVDAITAPSSQLILQMSTLVDQIILFGVVGSSQTIALGLSARPLVMLITRGSDPLKGTYVLRPSAVFTDTANSSVSVGAASMSITAPKTTAYAVFRRTF